MEAVVEEERLSPEAAQLAARVAQARDGDARAFRDLMRDFQDVFYGAARRYAGSHEDAADVVQDAFVKIYQGLAGLEQPAAFFSWARRIVINTALDHIRRRRRSAAVEVDIAGDAREREVEDQGERPDHGIERREFFAELESALGELPPRQREVVLLHDVEGFSGEEIAEILGIPRATVRSNLFYAREKLRRSLARHR